MVSRISTRFVLRLISVAALAHAFGSMSQADHVSPASSASAAEEALQLLSSGDRMGAIRRALEGLPEHPDENSITSHVQAWSTLWRAVAAKVIVADGDPRVIVSVSPDGSRMLVASGVAGKGSIDGRMPVTLFDTATGEALATPIPIEESESATGLRADRDGYFSPGGKYAAVELLARNATAILDGRTGERLMDLGGAEPHLPVGFSHDGSYFAAMSGLQVVVWDLGTGKERFRLPLPMPSVSGFMFPEAWSADGRILGATRNHSGSIEGAIVSIGTDGIRDLVDVPTIDGGGILTTPGRSEFLVSGSDKTLFYSGTGQLLGEGPGSTGRVAAFTRGGEAFAFLRRAPGLSAYEIDAYDLSGQQLEVSPRDFGKFDSIVVSTNGDLLGQAMFAENSHKSYEGLGVPLGPELYDIALSELDDDVLVAEPEQVPATTADQSMLDQSLSHARDARSALLRGDRLAALVAALKGLPETPSEDDIEIFDAAWMMLARAVAARPARLSISGFAGYSVTPEGNRAVLFQMPNDKEEPGRAYLFDPLSNEVILELTHPDRTEEGFILWGERAITFPRWAGGAASARWWRSLLGVRYVGRSFPAGPHRSGCRRWRVWRSPVNNRRFFP